MVQIFDSGPSFSSRLASAFFNPITESIQQQAQSQLQERLLRQKQAGDLAKEQQKISLKQAYLDKILGPQEQQEGPLSQRFDQEMQPGQEMTRGQLQKRFDPSQISDESIVQAASVDPVLGRELRAAKDASLKQARFEKEFEEKQRLTSPEFQRERQISQEQAKNDIAYNKELQSAHKQHELKSQTLDRLEKLNKQGVTGKPYEKFLEKSGLIALTSDGRREFAADVKNLITDIRSILGGQFSQFEFQTILNAYPSADFSPTANDAIIKNLQEFQNIRKKEFEIANEIKKENKGKVPFDFQSQVNEKLQEYTQSRIPEIKKNTQQILADEYGIKPGNVLLLDPSGEPLDVSPEDVEKYLNLGATRP